MFTQRHAFNVVIPVFLYIVNQLGSEFIVCIPSVGVIRVGAPGTKVYFIDIDRLFQVIVCSLLPSMIVEVVV